MLDNDFPVTTNEQTINYIRSIWLNIANINLSDLKSHFDFWFLIYKMLKASVQKCRNKVDNEERKKQEMNKTVETVLNCD